MPEELERQDQNLTITPRPIYQIDPEQPVKKANIPKIKNVQSSQTKVYKVLLALASISIISLVIRLKSHSESQQISLNNPKAPQDQKNVPPFYLENYINGEVKDVLSNNRFYDIHFYMKDKHSQKQHKVLLQSETELVSERSLLKFTQTDQEIEELIKVMRRQGQVIKGHDLFYLRRDFNEKKARDAYFFGSLNKNPNDPKYLEAEFYWHDKRHNISQYGKELPLCAIMIGKNNKKVISKMYKSIQNQNYTNFKVIHVDDGSDDGTVKSVQDLIQNSSVLSKRVTLVVQPRQMNSLYNRNFSYSLCGEDDIIVDMDSDDWLIGRQVFQLVNTVYQQGGNSYNASDKTDTWAVYFNLIRIKQGAVSYITSGNVANKVIRRQNYRCLPPNKWRTTHLRTFLHKIYKKVDTRDFIDPITQKIFMIRQDTFIQSAILELSAPKHIKFIDEFVYFYEEYPGKKDYDFITYAQKMARTLAPYYPLKSLDDEVRRNYDFKPTKILLDQKTKFSAIAKTKYEQAKKQIMDLVEEQKAQQ